MPLSLACSRRCVNRALKSSSWSLSLDTWVPPPTARGFVRRSSPSRMRIQGALPLSCLLVLLLAHGGHTFLLAPRLSRGSGLSSIIHFDNVDAALRLNPLLATLRRALNASDMLIPLNETGFVATLVAPTNSAFKSLLHKLDLTEEQLLENKDLLTKVLQYHVIPDLALKVEDLHDGEIEETLLPGQFLTFMKETYLYLLTKVLVRASDPNQRSATVLLPDIEAGKVVIHVISRVLLPEDEEQLV